MSTNLTNWFDSLRVSAHHEANTIRSKNYTQHKCMDECSNYSSINQAHLHNYQTNTTNERTMIVTQIFMKK